MSREARASRMRNPLDRIRKSRRGKGEGAQLTPAEMLRIRMWEARSSHSRSTGVALLGLSGVFLALSFLTSFVAFEILALVSFVVGVFLISVELEPRTKLLPSAESLMGPLLALAGDLEARGFGGNVVYVPRNEGVTMRVTKKNEKEESGRVRKKNNRTSDPLELLPVGRGIVVSVEREIGSLKDAEFSYLKAWVPKAFEKGLSLAEGARIDSRDGGFDALFDRPFVRPLCVREEFNQKVCGTIGCPLVSSVGEILASSTGKEVAYRGCSYDRMRETSHAVYELKAGD